MEDIQEWILKTLRKEADGDALILKLFSQKLWRLHFRHKKRGYGSSLCRQEVSI